MPSAAIEMTSRTAETANMMRRLPMKSMLNSMHGQHPPSWQPQEPVLVTSFGTPQSAGDLGMMFSASSMITGRLNSSIMSRSHAIPSISVSAKPRTGPMAK